MNIIPVLHCLDMQKSIAFYTVILDFERVGTWPETGSPAYTILERAGAELHLSTHSGDSKCGMAVTILVNDIDTLFNTYRQRGLAQPQKQESPVHQGPLDQTWGTREFYIDDPDGNTLRFTQRESSMA